MPPPFRIIQAWQRPGGWDCVAPWVQGEESAGRISGVVIEDAEFNDAPGTQTANNVRYYAFKQLAAIKLPACPNATIGDWDGTTSPSRYRVTGGPPVVTAADITLETATQVADAAAAAAKKVGGLAVEGTQLLLGLALIVAVVLYSGRK